MATAVVTLGYAMACGGTARITPEPVPDDASDPFADNPDAAGGDAARETGSTTPGVDVFADAGAFQSRVGPTARHGPHNFPGNTPTTNPAGQPCKGCHSGFSFGGTVYTSSGGTAPAPGVEVRVVDNAGKVFVAYTDQDGNFYIKGGGAVFPGVTGARGAGGSLMMVSKAPNGDCNSSGCHSGGATPIYVP